MIPHHLQEHPSKDGKLTFALACGPLLRPRYINPKLEKELVEFKLEVEEKHAKAGTRKYIFPRFENSDNNDHHQNNSVSPSSAVIKIIRSSGGVQKPQ